MASLNELLPYAAAGAERAEVLALRAQLHLTLAAQPVFGHPEFAGVLSTEAERATQRSSQRILRARAAEDLERIAAEVASVDLPASAFYRTRGAVIRALWVDAASTASDVAALESVLAEIGPAYDAVSLRARDPIAVVEDAPGSVAFYEATVQRLAGIRQLRTRDVQAARESLRRLVEDLERALARLESGEASEVEQLEGRIAAQFLFSLTYNRRSNEGWAKAAGMGPDDIDEATGGRIESIELRSAAVMMKHEDLHFLANYTMAPDVSFDRALDGGHAAMAGRALDQYAAGFDTGLADPGVHLIYVRKAARHSEEALASAVERFAAQARRLVAEHPAWAADYILHISELYVHRRSPAAVTTMHHLLEDLRKVAG